MGSEVNGVWDGSKVVTNVHLRNHCMSSQALEKECSPLMYKNGVLLCVCSYEEWTVVPC